MDCLPELIGLGEGKVRRLLKRFMSKSKLDRLCQVRCFASRLRPLRFDPLRGRKVAFRQLPLIDVNVVDPVGLGPDEDASLKISLKRAGGSTKIYTPRFPKQGREGTLPWKLVLTKL